MKALAILFILFSYSANCQIDTLIQNQTPYQIPTKKLNFRAENTSIDEVRKSAKRQISLGVNGDSIYVYQKTNGKAYLTRESADTLLTVEIGHSILHKIVPPGTDLRFHYTFDSLNTNAPYLILFWSHWETATTSRYSGSQEYLCHQKQTNYSTRSGGACVISLISNRVIFKGFSKIEYETTEKHYPGNSSKIIESKADVISILNMEHDFLSIIRTGNPDQNYFSYYDSLEYGSYVIENDVFVLKVKR